MTRIVWRIARRSLSLASVRYRALLPALALQAHGFESRFADSDTGLSLDHADLLVISKSFSHLDIDLCRQARSRKIAVTLDLCDNIFVPGYGQGLLHRPADVFRSMAGHAQLVTCPTEALAEVIRDELGRNIPVAVVPDSVETPELVRQQARLLIECPAIGKPDLPMRRRLLRTLRSVRSKFSQWQRKSGDQGSSPEAIRSALGEAAVIVWFGNHGSTHGSAGLTDILLFRSALEQLASEQSVRLLVVSNSRSRFDQLIAPLSIPAVYQEWSPEALDQALSIADVAIIPNSQDVFSIGKSANRTVLCLQAGLPVVATPTRALDPLAGAIWTDDPLQGLKQYLSDPVRVKTDLLKAGELIQTHFSLDAVGLQWQQLYRSVLR